MFQKSVTECVMVGLPHLFKVDESNEQRCDGKVEVEKESANDRMTDPTRLSTPDKKWMIKRKIWGRKKGNRYAATEMGC